jgi:hypothetical protein
VTIEGGSDFIKLTLNFHQRQMLRFIAQRGGRVNFKFGALVNLPNVPDTIVKKSDDSVSAMEKMGLTVHIPMIGQADTVEIVLTDIGRNVIEQMGIMGKSDA